ncbi:hypothetical protein ERO13_D12G133000v2 [Gossypium hirsutum]|uniref:Pectinesterase inhibitor domain-containing protein n=1 Tax=Gossypium darwinii TaxID=34276 RepID=A0A5D2A9V3_GOSDA|nr:hypothetical protein ERO13_D12G133000v2 [Gossypium hirsutum]TYG41199.1 hypothetical protein ES288_D12G157000v1 [Gossypium darwinii]
MKPIITNNVAVALSFFIFLSFFPLLNATKYSDMVNEICPSVNNTKLCSETLKNDLPDDIGASDSFIVRFVNIAKGNATEVSASIDKSIGSGGEGSVDLLALEKCQVDIKSAVQELGTAAGLVSYKEYTKARNHVADAKKFSHLCVKKLQPNTKLYGSVKTITELCEIVDAVLKI